MPRRSFSDTLRDIRGGEVLDQLDEQLQELVRAVQSTQAGGQITLTLIVTAKPLVGKGYLYPLIPFDRKKLARLLYRRPVTKKNS